MEYENGINFATNSKKRCPNEHTHPTLFFIFLLFAKFILNEFFCEKNI
jgi:hypothetical protein